MAITINIAGVDRTNKIDPRSVTKRDVINQTVDTLEFKLEKYSGQSYFPAPGEEVTMFNGATKEFGGKIIGVEAAVEAPHLVVYTIRCKDYTFDIERKLVVEQYENMTVNDIIADLIDTYAPTFTYTNVDCDTMVTKVIFDRITLVEVFQRLVDMTGYSWYVDYDKDVHFFAKHTELAPFDLTDGAYHIPDSLTINTDFSQVRNRVFVKGGEVEGSDRTETFDGDGVKTHFKLSNKFSRVPAVVVDSVSKTVGVDFIDNDADFDCFWDYSQQYVRFKDTTIPAAGTNNVEVTGLPLYNLVVQVEDPQSIVDHGLFEYAKIDKNIKSREEAIGLAKTELAAYKDGVLEASFETYDSGLRSGQIINITSTNLGIDEDYVIQSVSFKIINDTVGRWTVDLATLRTVQIVDFLLTLLRQPGRVIEDKGEIVLEKTVFPVESIGFTDVIDINTNNELAPETIGCDDNSYVQALGFTPVYVAGPYVHDPTNATDFKRVFILNSSTLS